MKRNIIILFFAVLTITNIFAQTQEAITSTGKKVILNPDGTWNYVEVEKDIILNPSDCNNWIETVTDKVSGRISTGAKKLLIVSTDDGKTGFGIHMIIMEKGQLILSIQAVGAGSCIDEGDKINLLFTDGSRLELASDGKFNCEGNATVYFGGIFGKKAQLNILKTKKIETMRVWTSDSYVEKDFTEENQNEFFHVINCLIK